LRVGALHLGPRTAKQQQQSREQSEKSVVHRAHPFSAGDARTSKQEGQHRLSMDLERTRGPTGVVEMEA
jgi:hypothetical protein